MSRTKSLIKNTFIIAFGTILPRLMSIITLPILTSKLLTTEYGLYDLIETLISLFIPIVTLKIDAAAFRYLINARDNKKESSKVITNIFAVIVLSCIISIIILFIIFRNQNLLLLFLILLYFVLDVLNTTMSQIVRGLAQNKVYSISTIINSFLRMICLCLLLLPINLGLLGVITALIIGTSISLLYQSFIIKINKYINLKLISKKTIKELLSYSWPLIPNSLSVWALNASDRLVIVHYLGIEQNAIYAVANKIPNLLNLFNTTFNMAWQENASVNYKDSDIENYYSNTFSYFLSFIAGGCALIIAATPIMFKILIHGNYEKAYYQMPILFLGIFYSCIMSFLGGIYAANKRTKSVGVTTIISAIVNITIDFLLIKKIGIYAGSISTLVSYVIVSYYRMYDLKKYQNIYYNYKKVIFVNIGLIILASICMMRNVYLNIFNVILAIVFAYILNRNIIKIGYKYIQKKIKGV